MQSFKFPVKDLCYADDTLIAARSAEVATKLLRRIQEEARIYNMRLGLKKCEQLAGERHKEVVFLECGLMEKKLSSRGTLGLFPI